MEAPSLRFVADFRVLIGAPIVAGKTEAGLRRIIPILGGTIAGPRLNGRILAAGADFQLIGDDGFTTLEARYAAELDDGAMIYVNNIGVRSGPPAVMARIMAGEVVDPDLVYFRTTPRFETTSQAHAWLTRKLFLATAGRFPDHVELAVYEVD
jgi:hypothetical protein